MQGYNPWSPKVSVQLFRSYSLTTNFHGICRWVWSTICNYILSCIDRIIGQKWNWDIYLSIIYENWCSQSYMTPQNFIRQSIILCIMWIPLSCSYWYMLMQMIYWTPKLKCWIWPDWHKSQLSWFIIGAKNISAFPNEC